MLLLIIGNEGDDLSRSKKREGYVMDYLRFIVYQEQVILASMLDKTLPIIPAVHSLVKKPVCVCMCVCVCV